MTFFLLVLVAVCTSSSPTLLFEWNTIDYAWPSDQIRQEAILAGTFIPENNAIAGVKVDAFGNVCVTVPRWKRGVPATLSRVDPKTVWLV
jgi:hypothetical protein